MKTPTAALILTLVSFSLLKAEDAVVLPPETDAYAQGKLFYEHLWQSKIERAVGYIPGAIVTVNVELASLSNKTSHEQATTVSAIEDNSRSPKSAATKSEARSLSAIPKQVSVTVAIPSTYYRSIAAVPDRSVEKLVNEYANVKDEVRNDVEAIVGMLLPYQQSQMRKPMLVTFFEDRMLKDDRSARVSAALSPQKSRSRLAAGVVVPNSPFNPRRVRDASK